MEKNLSYSSAPLGQDILYKTYMDMIKEWALHYPDKDAFVEYSGDGKRMSLTCKELLIKSERFGMYLLSIGVQKGDVVVICMSNSLEMIVSIFGVASCGGIVACTTSNLQDGSDVIELLKDTSAILFIINTDPNGLNWGLANVVKKSCKDLKLKKIICSTDHHCDLNDHGELLISMKAAMESDYNENLNFPDVQPEDPVIYFQMSGSSEKPKLTLHPHYTWITCSRIFNNQIGIDAKSVYFCDRPFGWGAGSARTFLASGSTRVFVETSLAVSKNSIDLISDVIAAEACTHAYIPGYIAVDLIKRPDLKNQFKTIENITYAGERFSRSLVSLVPQFCKRLSVWYGSTEMNGVSVFISSDPDAFETGIIGLPSPGVEMKLVTPDGRVAEKDESGELFARTIFRFTQYVGIPEKFAEAVDNQNWFHSGDISHVREDGNYVLEGRASEQISMATMKIFPFEIEKELIKCPGVTSVMAVPIPDMRLNNVVCACVILDKSSSVNLSNVKEFCEKTWVKSSSGTGISLRPEYYLEFDQFETNANAKLDRRMIARLAREKLKL